MAADDRLLTTPVVRTHGLTRRYGDRVVLDDVTLRIDSGEFVALIGRSGSGKSTLLKALAALDDDVEGEGTITVPDNRSVLFQDSRLLPWTRVLNNVTLGLRDPDAEARGRRALADVGLAGRERAWPNALSGGEQQRVALARSLVREPQLLLADEPFGALDALTRIRMHALLLDLVTAHRPAVLLVTHDVDEAVKLADRVVVLEAGRLVLDLPVDLDRPRDPLHPAFVSARRQLLRALGVGDRASSTTDND
ncbi:ABC transporter ATP-binding protein [Saccharomonospora glauca]|uniref:ABC-type nitrate/sulfonate/bicarbonate transport system, ATPase component n=1 Tax=Saccharomonospora glauca K62 TaxID=928724 RepID=I1D1G5_9PSEU|nr:ABC transporter ATP-binding protein [Saccharomonospora glauca]EIE98789.1 ABC-type nitrate/sulfonate/bicarbonate transport system, ATPase component [Saccharomonospora glauca K62]